MGFDVLYLRLSTNLSQKLSLYIQLSVYKSMEDNIPKFDLPVDFIVGNSITGEILNQYGRFPCKIKAGIFVLLRTRDNPRDCKLN